VLEVLRLDGVCKAFDRGRDRISVLEDVSLSVGAGEIVSVVGTRAQGKSTLIRLASGTLRADSGSVCVGGVKLGGLKDKDLSRILARDLGVAARNGLPEVRVRVREHVEFSLRACNRLWSRQWPERELRLRVTEVLDELGLSACADSKWEELSDWQRVLVELAQAVAVRPKLLLIDDLVDGFGLDKKQAMMELLEGFARDLGCGVLLAVSDHASALRSVQIWQLNRGKLKLIADHTQPDVIPLHQHRREGRAWSTGR
jgi:ABC-type cobalamin/Fe3+-siderophores transport system ATPase subunit